MLDDALNGTFTESSYDETKLSRLEARWKEFLGTSVLSNQNLEAERHRLEQFISDISHQTKTPMTNIKMYTELLNEEVNALQKKQAGAQGIDDTEINASVNRIKKYAEEIRRQNERLEFLIDSLTKLSRLESGTLEVVANPSAVNELVKAGVSAVKPKADTKKISFVTDGAEGEDSITASFDMKWTLEALINVLDNAVKYCDEGGKVEVGLTKKGKSAIFTVSNDYAAGEGVDYKRFFDRFYREDKSHNSEKQGYGIGLSMAESLVRMFKGRITVNYKKPVITFTITL
jgi:signal transduction histidine kinase